MVGKLAGVGEIVRLIELAVESGGWVLSAELAGLRAAPSLNDAQRCALRALAGAAAGEEAARHSGLTAAAVEALGDELRREHGITNGLDAVNVARRLGALTEAEALALLT